MKMITLLLLILFFVLFSSIALADDFIETYDDPYNQSYAVYTQSTETHCINGTCSLVLYSGTRFVEEDNEWKRIEKAKSLKNVWKKVYLEKDPDFDIEIVKLNYTDIELNFTFNSSIWVNYPECSDSKEIDTGDMVLAVPANKMTLNVILN